MTIRHPKHPYNPFEDENLYFPNSVGGLLSNMPVDSTDPGMWGEGESSETVANFKKGGSAKKKAYGMRKGGFTNRGGMYS